MENGCRPRLARFDRPALRLEDLLGAEGDDFIHVAFWTLVGRRVLSAELIEWRTLAGQAEGKVAALCAMHKGPAANGIAHRIPGLHALMLLHARSQIPVLGPILALATKALLRHRWLGWPVRLTRSLPGKFRYTYRHSRKALIRTAQSLGLPDRKKIRSALRMKHAPVPPGTEPRIAELYIALCLAIDHAEGNQ